MAGDIQSVEAEPCEPAMWRACAGCAVEIPAVNSMVYYFPQGHMEQCSDPQSVPSLISHLPPTPYHICRVLEVLYLVDPESDEVFTRIRLEPLGKGRILDEPPPRPANEEVVVSFAKVMTLSDANNGGGFSVPRACADSVFPALDFEADPPVQTLYMRDLRGNSWHFRHIYRGTPRRHLLTTGWSKYVNSKRLISGDSVVFMRNTATGMLYLGVRRAKKSISSAELERWAAMYGGSAEGVRQKNKKKDKLPAETVANALELAAAGKPFQVVYYPKRGSQCFVVAASRVEAAMAVPWRPGRRVKIALPTEDSSRFTCLQGTVSYAFPCVGDTWQTSPWTMLQVAWDEAGVVKDMERINPWQVEGLEPLGSIEGPAKKQKVSQNWDGKGTQGARQNTNLVGTDLILGCSSQSPDSSITFKASTSPVVNATPVKLFGQTIYIPADCERVSTAEMQELEDDQVDPFALSLGIHTHLSMPPK